MTNSFVDLLISMVKGICHPLFLIVNPLPLD